MKFPDKVTPFNMSTFPLMVLILKALAKEDLKPSQIAKTATKNGFTVTDAMESLECLYALGKIELTDSERKIHYVD